MVATLCILMSIAALAFVLFVEPDPAPSEADVQLAPLVRKKEILYENLRDLRRRIIRSRSARRRPSWCRC